MEAKRSVVGTQFATHVGDHRPPARDQRRSFDELGTEPSDYEAPNQMVQHPPFYYAAAAGWASLLPSFDSRRFDVQLWWLRLFSTLLLMPVPWLIAAAGRILRAPPSVSIAAALIPLGVPSYIRTGASVTNDALLTVALVAASVLLVRMSCGDARSRTAVMFGAVWAVELLTKGPALALAPTPLLACMIGAAGSWRARLRAAWRPAATAIGLGGALGG